MNDGWMDGCMSGWMDGWMQNWMQQHAAADEILMMNDTYINHDMIAVCPARPNVA
jgi:hypothetical protein